MTDERFEFIVNRALVLSIISGLVYYGIVSWVELKAWFEVVLNKI